MNKKSYEVVLWYKGATRVIETFAVSPEKARLNAVYRVATKLFPGDPIGVVFLNAKVIRIHELQSEPKVVEIKPSVKQLEFAI